MECMCFTFTCANCVLTGGPPDDVNNVSVSLIACGLVVQWREPSRVCGTIWYTVTVSTEGGILIITDYTTMTNYSVTGGLNDNTVYHVNVTASNNAGSSGLTSISVITNGKFVRIQYVCIYIKAVSGLISKLFGKHTNCKNKIILFFYITFYYTLKFITEINMNPSIHLHILYFLD